MNLLYSSKIVWSAATKASSFKYSGGVAGVSKMISNGRGRSFRRRGQNAFVAVADDAAPRVETVNHRTFVARQEFFRRRQRGFDQMFRQRRAVGEIRKSRRSCRRCAAK